MDETAPDVPPELPPLPRPVARPVAKRAPARQKRVEREEIYDDEPKKSNTALLLAVAGFAAFLLLSVVVGVGWYFWAEGKAGSQQATFSYVGTKVAPVGNTGYNSATSAYRLPPIVAKKPRPFYVATMARPLTLEDGVATVTGKLDDADPQVSFRPIKAYSLSLDANRMYFFELRSSDSHAFGPEIKLLAANNLLLASGRMNTERTANRFVFTPAKTQMTTLQLWLAENQPCNFTLTIREATNGSEWPEGFEKVLVQERVTTNTNRVGRQHSAGAFSPVQSGIYWLVSDNGDLERFTPEQSRFDGVGKLQWKVNHLAADGDGGLFLAAKVGVPYARMPKQPPVTMKEEIQFFSKDDLAKVRSNTPMKPTDTFNIEGTVTAMCLNAEEKALFVLDGKTNAVIKFDTGKREVAEQNGLIMAGAKGMLLTKDGKSLYLCGIGNKVQKLDAATLKIEKTINFMDAAGGEYDGIQVSDRGLIYLAGKNKDYPRRWVAYLDPATEGTPKLMPFEVQRGASSILLNPDQRRLFVSHNSSAGMIEEHFISPIPMMLEGQNAMRCPFAIAPASTARMTLSPDGRWLISERGPYLKLEP